MSGRTLFLLCFGFLTVVAAMGFLADRYLSRNNPAPATITKTDLAFILDSVNSQHQRSIRAAVDSTASKMQARQIVEKHYYYANRSEDQKAEQDFKDGLVDCYTVIEKKNKSIVSATQLWKRSDSLRTLDSIKLKSFAGELISKDTTIAKMRRESVVLQNQKQPFRVYATVGAERYAENTNATVGASLQLRNGLLVNYSKGINQNSHSVTAGFPISLKRKR